MSHDENLTALWQLIDTQHTSTSSHKYDVAERTIGSLVGDTSPQIYYFTYISRVSNFSVRASQSTGALKSDAVVALIQRRTEDSKTHRAARTFVERTGKPVFLLQREAEESKKWFPIGGYALSVDSRGQALLSNLTKTFGGPAHVTIDASQEFTAVNAVKYLESLGISGSAIGSALSGWHDLRSLLDTATKSSMGLSAAESAIVARRREIVAELKEMIADKSVTERDLHRKIHGNYWIFGGKYTGVSERNGLIPMDEYDVPLFCADGSIHIVELKGSHIPSLVERYRSHLIPGTQVHQAVGQALNYLRDLDEVGSAMESYYKRNGFEYDLCRARATVVIGNPAFVNIPEDKKRKFEAVTRQMVDQTIRTYNGSINRIEVLTWADLLDAADRSLTFEGENVGHLANPSPDDTAPTIF
ncbi:Shedu anti-phage system protein SduA domain-containing protein [Streptomyces canus]|uniref:Shedu anti-phage system protein SduA domain-containing protein n=1 Tax=Streptomyces canus TaxID=58343 RepID=UPI003252EC42